MKDAIARLETVTDVEDSNKSGEDSTTGIRNPLAQTFPVFNCPLWDDGEKDVAAAVVVNDENRHPDRIGGVTTTPHHQEDHPTPLPPPPPTYPLGSDHLPPPQHYYYRNPSSKSLRKQPTLIPLKFRKYSMEGNMLQNLKTDISQNTRVPRDAKTERRCQLFSIIVTILCLLAIFFFAMTHSVWSSVIMEDHYKSYCLVTDVIPLEGTADCKSERSRTKTEVHCTITCNYGIDESQTDNNFVLVGDNSFTMSCDVAKNSWAYDVMKICLSAPVSVDEQ